MNQRPEITPPPIIPVNAEVVRVVDRSEDSKERFRRAGFRLHPISGVLVILIDNLFFGVSAITLGLAIPIVCFLAFTITTTGVFLAQKFLDGDRFGVSLAKAFFAGVLAGVPTSITGTIFGTFVLFTSGLSSFNQKNSPK